MRYIGFTINPLIASINTLFDINTYHKLGAI